jgi:hypothetical protein
MTIRIWTGCLIGVSAAITLLMAGAATAETANPLAEKVRALDSRFEDVAVAKAEGYAPIPCASGLTGGAMGIHYVNAAYLKDDAVDVAKPEAVMYEPMSDGTLKLVAVEYITAKGPASLEGHLFNFNTAPNRYGLGPFYELHVWPGSRIRPAPSPT